MTYLKVLKWVTPVGDHGGHDCSAQPDAIASGTLLEVLISSGQEGYGKS